MSLRPSAYSAISAFKKAIYRRDRRDAQRTTEKSLFTSARAAS